MPFRGGSIFTLTQYGNCSGSWRNQHLVRVTFLTQLYVAGSVHTCAFVLSMLHLLQGLIMGKAF